MAGYRFSNGSTGTVQALTTTYKTLWGITAATGATTLRRGWVYHVQFAIDTVPADNVISFKIDRQTTIGTSTVCVPIPDEAADAAALLSVGVNHTTEPTVTASTQLIETALNQRSTYQWTAVPGRELVIPATNVAGIGARAKSPAYASTSIATCHFWE